MNGPTPEGASRLPLKGALPPDRQSRLRGSRLINETTMQTIQDHRALRFLTAGSVDDGKSTLIGRLLFDSRAILADQLDTLEKKAAAELRDAGIKAYLPMETISGSRKLSNGCTRPFNRRVPIVRSCVFSGGKPPFAEHVKHRIGPKEGACQISRAELSGLYKTARHRERKPRARKFSVGDQISIKVGPLANLGGTIVEDKGRFYRVAVSLFGKTHTQAFSEMHLEKRIIRDG